jgi:putative Mn2+ efflux pump MntP
VEREFGCYADLFAEHVGEYNYERPSQLVDGGGSWRVTKTQQVDFHIGVGLNSSTVNHYFGLGYSLPRSSLGKRHLEIHRDLIVLAKSFGVALAVGLDVLAVSVGVGVTGLAFDASIRVGCAFAGSEIAMQVIGYALGSGAGRFLGTVATYVGLVLLAAIGGMMIRNSFRDFSEPAFDATRGTGLVMTSLSISLDSLGVGMALPTVAIPLLPLLIIVSITTTIFTFVGLTFGARLGERYERSAERTAGALLMLLASWFAIEHFI